MELLNIAARLALGGDEKRNYLLSAVVKRSDGALVVSTNALTKEPEPAAHAEARALRKADWGATLYVARVLRQGGWALAKPCGRCQALIRSRGVKKVYYTIGPNEYGVWEPGKQKNP
jgi:tRNA(Arg) A34 adenosine deaminase TadA